MRVADTLKIKGDKDAVNWLGGSNYNDLLSSNLAAPTLKNPSGYGWKAIFETEPDRVAIISGKYKVPRKVLTNSKGNPYRVPRLVDHQGDLAKPWFIVFYVWDIGLKKLVRKRMGKDELNANNVKARRARAFEMIAQLTDELKNGGQVESQTKVKEVSAFNFHGYKLIDAFSFAREYKLTVQKKSRSTGKEFYYTKTTLMDFIKHEGLDPNLLLRQVTQAFLQHYCIFLRTVRNLSNKTYNDRLANLHTCFELLRKLDSKLWPQNNPAARLEKLSTTTKTHAAYSTDMLKEISELIKPRDPQLLLFIRFIYYSLARPKELRFVKVAHIRLQFNKMLMVGEHSKTDYEQYIGISEEFESIIKNSGILNYPADSYIFTDKGTPGATQVGTGYFYKRFRVYLAQLGYKKLAAYTMYSFKHSGAVQLYLTSKDPYLVQRQLRHKSMVQTQTYLRDLGLFVDFKKLKNWKGF